jgi:hypothetical protein
MPEGWGIRTGAYRGSVEKAGVKQKRILVCAGGEPNERRTGFKADPPVTLLWICN